MLLLLKLTFIIVTLTGYNDIQENRLLFNGVSLDGWMVIDFEGHGNISVADSCVIIGKGSLISGIRWTGDFPTTNYEVSLDAKRVEGSDFFCGMTFPVKESFLTLVLGGWGGSLVGLSSIEGYDAANNSTGTLYHFAPGWWYHIRLKVTDEKIEAWIEDEKIVDFTINNSYLSLRWEVESSVPFGITTYKTTGAIRNIRQTIFGPVSDQN
jgi:hypothetical protein